MTTKKRKSDGDALSNLTEPQSESVLKRLDALEDKFRRLVDRESAASTETGTSDILHLNIGGTKTTVSRRILTSIPGSMPATKFSGGWDDSIEKDKDGDFL